MTDLKPCPFCGGAVTIANYGDYLSIISKGTDPRNSCRCRLFMESDKFAEDDSEAKQRAKERLIEKWNRRFDGWHTEPPTEDGQYFVAYRWGLDNQIMHDMAVHIQYGATEFFNGNWKIEFPYVVLAWMPIEPYKEASNG